MLAYACVKANGGRRIPTCRAWRVIFGEASSSARVMPSSSSSSCSLSMRNNWGCLHLWPGEKRSSQLKHNPKLRFLFNSSQVLSGNFGEVRPEAVWDMLIESMQDTHADVIESEQEMEQKLSSSTHARAV